MPNHYFQFKQFIIQQDKCAMKVCTDACLFGAYMAAEQLQHTVLHTLDIGTGTGLLSLMLAQKHAATIDTVETDEQAYQQATANIARAGFAAAINTFHCGINDFLPAHRYDFIISNPPFFEDDLQSNDTKKNAAKHDTALTLQQLLDNINRLLKEDGFAAVLLPYHRTAYFETAAAPLNFYISKKILVKQTPKHGYFRSMLIFSRKKAATQTDTIVIKTETGNYSEPFISLLKGYYLHL